MPARPVASSVMLTGSGVTVVQVAGRPPGVVPVEHSVAFPRPMSRPRSVMSDLDGSHEPPVIWNVNRVHPFPFRPLAQGLEKMFGPVLGVCAEVAHPLLIPTFWNWGVARLKSVLNITPPLFFSFQASSGWCPLPVGP